MTRNVRFSEDFIDEVREEMKNICKEKGLYNFLESYVNHEIPQSVDLYEYPQLKGYMHAPLRFSCINYSCYPLLDMNLIDTLCSVIRKKKVLEIMSGSGAIAKGLQDKGIEIIPTDNFSEFTKASVWTEVEELDSVKAIEKYGEKVDYILVSWPRGRSNITECVQTMHKINPTLKLIYIGERENGCCAPSRFFKKVELQDTKTIKNWPFIYDAIYVFK